MAAIKKSNLSPYKKKDNKFKNRLTPALAAVSSIALAGLTGLAARKIIKNKDKAKIQEIVPQQDNCEEKLKILRNSLETEIQKLKEQIKNEEQANIKLVDQINRCNKEVIRQSRILSLKPNLLKEATMRSEIKRLAETVKNINK